MKRLRKIKLIWIALILSLFVHFFLISHFNYLLEVSSNKEIIEKSYVVRISLKLKTDLPFPVENAVVPNLKKEITPSPVMKKIENQEEITEGFTQKGSNNQVIEEETSQGLAETKKKNYQIKEESEKELLSNKMIPAENKETEKEAEQEKERNLSSQSKKNEYLKEKSVQENYNITSQEADYKNEGQVKENPEIEETLDFTRKNYQDNVNPPELLEFQRPVYPKDLRERDIEGKVTLKILIDKEGEVKEIQIFESSGYKTFDQIAIKSVRQWRFKPAKKGNQARESWVLIPINFQIN